MNELYTIIMSMFYIDTYIHLSNSSAYKPFYL